MRPLAILKCLGKAVLKHALNLAGFGLGDVVEEVWNDWNKELDGAQRQDELQAVVQMAADQFREQVEAVVRDVAAGQPDAVRRHVSDCLLQLPDQLHRSFRRSDDPQGISVPPDLRLKQVSDLATLLSSTPAGPTASAEARVTIQLTAGHAAGESIVCTEPTVLLFGRAKDCRPLYPQEGHNTVSRHHCLVDINPPDVRLRDLGSLHGTYVNGQKLGGRPQGTEPDAKYASPEIDLTHGTEVRLTDKGLVAFRVDVYIPARCAACEAVIAEEQKSVCAQESGGFLCPKCRLEDREATAGVKTCTWCHREVQAERGANRPGLFVCGDCRANMQAIMQDMMGQAQAGNPELRAIRDYTFIEELGHGGMGAVFLARHNKSHQAVAIKLMLPKVAADDRAVEMFQREVRNTMSLRHRHIVQLLDHGYARGTFFMVLEYYLGN